MGSSEAIQNNNQRHVILTAFIFIIALSLRFYQLGHECLWIDEVSSIDQALRPLPELFSGFIRGPFYYFLLRFWIKLFGLSEFSLRLPSVVFAVASVYLTYRLGKIMFSRFVGQTGALFLSISLFHIFFSQEVRHYSLWVFLTLLSNLLFLKILKKENPVKIYAYYSLVMILSLYTILWSALMWIVHNLIFIFEKRFNRKWFIAQAVIFIIFLFWLIPFILFMFLTKDALPVLGIDWILPVSWISLAGFFKTILSSGIYFGATPIENIQISFLQALQIYIFLTLFILGITGIRIKKNKNIFLFLWLFLPFAFILVASMLTFPLFSERYLIFTLPAFFIVTAVGISRFKIRAIRISIVTLMALINLPALWHYYGQDQKTRYDTIIGIISKSLKPQANIIIDSCPEALVASYYFEKKSLEDGNQPFEIRRKIGSKMLAGGIAYKGRGYNLIIAKDKKQISKFAGSGVLLSFPELWLISRDSSGVKEYLTSFLGSPAVFGTGVIKLFYYKNRHQNLKVEDRD